MKSAAYVSISQQMVLGRRMDAIAQNLANLNTPAFKGERLLFEEYLHTAEDGQPISYVHEVSLERDMTGGPLDRTGNDLDVALDGTGWFVIGTDEGLKRIKVLVLLGETKLAIAQALKARDD